MHSQANICVCHQRKLCSAYSVYKDNKIAALKPLFRMCLRFVWVFFDFQSMFKNQNHTKSA